MLANIKKANLNFVSCPTENIHLEGRQDTYPKRRGLTRVKELDAAGINVCFAQDSISDPWYPLGNGNLMNILDAGIHICQLTGLQDIATDLKFITTNGAKALNIMAEYGIEAGKPANFIVLDASSPFEAIRERAAVLESVRNGKVLFQRKPADFTQCVAFLQ